MWAMFFGWLPVWGQAVIALIIAILVISIVLRVIGSVLDALPFI